MRATANTTSSKTSMTGPSAMNGRTARPRSSSACPGQEKSCALVPVCAKVKTPEFPSIAPCGKVREGGVGRFVGPRHTPPDGRGEAVVVNSSRTIEAGEVGRTEASREMVGFGLAWAQIGSWFGCYQGVMLNDGDTHVA